MGIRFNVIKTVITVRIAKFNIQQDGQCSINATLRRVRVTLVAVEKQCVAYSECVFRSQPYLPSTQCACAVLYHHLWPIRLYCIFPHYVINGTIFEKNVIEHKHAYFDFLYNFCRKQLFYE